MQSFISSPILAGAASFVLAVLLTWLVRGIASRYGFVANPKFGRVQKRPSAMLGGTAIFLATVLMYAAAVPKTTESLVVFAGSSFLFLLGLIDDIVNIKPYQKLIGQLIGATFVVGC